MAQGRELGVVRGVGDSTPEELGGFCLPTLAPWCPHTVPVMEGTPRLHHFAHVIRAGACTCRGLLPSGPAPVSLAPPPLLPIRALFCRPAAPHKSHERSGQDAYALRPVQQCLRHAVHLRHGPSRCHFSIILCVLGISQRPVRCILHPSVCASLPASSNCSWPRRFPGNARRYVNKNQDFAFVNFNVTAGSIPAVSHECLYLPIAPDLTPLFNWNTKQLFLYVSAEYENKQGVRAAFS